ncbi:hypothetical protein EQV77_01760 [Halobacillus fulvus]|nr:hypothetical protein EQV77_01760 [Halobacillus fulvus]
MCDQKVHVWIDADSCPVRTEIIHVCRKFNIVPNFIATFHHFRKSDEGEKWTYLDDGSQSVDLYIINHSTRGDIVVTQDLSLAVLLTSKGVYVITPRGKLIEETDAATILNDKHIRQKSLRQKKKWKGPSAFSKADREHFTHVFEDLMSMHEGI